MLSALDSILQSLYRGKQTHPEIAALVRADMRFW